MIFFKKNKNKYASDIDPLVNQVIGGQSVMFRLCRESLKVSEEEIRKIEITYFSLAVMCHSYLSSAKIMYWGGPQNEYAKEILDTVTIDVLKKSLISCGEKISLKEVAEEYKKKYNEYSPLLRPLLDLAEGFQGHQIYLFGKRSGEEGKKRDEEIIFNLKEIALIFFNSINKNVQKNSVPPMTLILSSTSLFVTYIQDNISFCNIKLGKID